MTAPTTRAHRKAARALLRDAQQPGLHPRSRAVLAVGAMQMCASSVFDNAYEHLRSAGGTDVEWQATCDALLATATRMLKRR